MKYALLLLLLLPSCGLNEVRSKWKIGPETRNEGVTSHQRWTVQTGLEGRFDNGVTAGITWRSRFNDDADGLDATDHGIWIDWSFPVWRKEE